MLRISTVFEAGLGCFQFLDAGHFTFIVHFECGFSICIREIDITVDCRVNELEVFA
jgi:hypothetical protein